MEKFQLDTSIFVPLYQQLKEHIIEKIDKKIWKPGDKIYSENQLYEMFAVSRNTAKRAIEDLVQEGILYRIQGKGTFVSLPKIEQSLSAFYSFSEVLSKKGLKPKDVVLGIKVIEASHQVAKALRIEKGEQVVMLQRIRYANDEPIILESSYLPKILINNEEKLKFVACTPLYNILNNNFNISVNSAKETFEPTLIREEEKFHLEVEVGSPALLLERIAYDPSKKPVEFCKSIVRGDRCKFYTELV
ncbi:GntR family transcriptional regulator [Virgibacillus sp. NKC19-3]|uniref:GntR family transcriptional regulator n=1 Tax=Virgibacillus saliphilus TaxID=2831674 RepID=UPI001C9AE94A|nr:GntR family transcriptional regulator [Virgibacillus sp. NKC19-3]MBY7142863.1 GntR family transcriptional regulator [Virgibacillus sp. NKC19-3]